MPTVMQVGIQFAEKGSIFPCFLEYSLSLPRCRRTAYANHGFTPLGGVVQGIRQACPICTLRVALTVGQEELMEQLFRSYFERAVPLVDTNGPGSAMNSITFLGDDW